MVYLHVITPSTEQTGRCPRDVFQGPFASAREAQGYITKLMMWFPEAMQEADYKIVSQPRPTKSATNA